MSQHSSEVRFSLPGASAPPNVAPHGDPAPAVTKLVATVLAVVSLVMVLANLQVTSLKNANTGSRYATIEALVDQGTYFIDKSRYSRTPDKVKLGKHYLSSKPPLLPTYGAGVYLAYQKVTGNTIRTHERQVVWLTSLATGWLSHLIFLVFFYKTSLLLIRTQTARIVTYASAAFAYLGMGYATAINNHSTAGALAIWGLYHAINAHRGGARAHFVYAGLILGVLPAIDLPMLAFSGTVGLYLFTRDRQSALLYYLPALLPGIATHLLLNLHITGSIVPTYLNAELKDYAESYFKRVTKGIDALREPKHVYAFHVLVGHHGLFSMTPLFGFSLFEMLRRARRGRPPCAESLLPCGTFLIVCTFVVFKTRNYGGWCVGMRWLIPIMPLFFLFFGIFLDTVKPGRVTWIAILMATAVSTFNAQDALASPFQFSRWHNFIEGKPNRNRVMESDRKRSQPSTKPSPRRRKAPKRK
jgi:hypothetical protein